VSTNQLDIEAKKAFASQLLNEGHCDVKIIKTPADLTSIVPETGQKHFWEIKGTKVTSGIVFGAATAIELEAAISIPNYLFVIAQKIGVDWVFHRLTPIEFIGYCTLPPAKVIFHYPLYKGTRQKINRGAIQATSERIIAIQDLFWKFRNPINLLPGD
jgi:hypothetical protein